MNHTIRAWALPIAVGALVAPTAFAESPEVTSLRQELEATRAQFETRIQALEARIQELQTAKPPVVTERLDTIEGRLQQVETASAQSSVPPPANPSAFNPQMSLILAGTWANLSENPDDYVLQGFIPGGEESGPGDRGFNLGETEMTLSSNIDPYFYGQATMAVTGEDEIGVEEAFARTTALPYGFTGEFGRILSAVGYINSQHAHAWDFVDAPLVYQAMFGGQYKNDGVQLKWLAPLDTFVELGVELGNGHEFPGDDNGNGVGATTLFASAGNDIGDSASWKAGMAWLSTEPEDRSYDEPDATQSGVANPTAFSGDSDTWSGYVIYKWAPNGNSRVTNLKLQAEYFDRREDGRLTQDNATLGTGISDFRSEQTGWYAQGVYQFMPAWRVGLRWESLDSGQRHLHSVDGVLTAVDFPTLDSYEPERGSLMFDYSPTEFSRLRLQFARDKSAPGIDDDQIYLQYLMSLGTHGAHQF